MDYVQENGLRGREFDALAAQNEHLHHWEATVADTRIHGTTRKQVIACFQTDAAHIASQKISPVERGIGHLHGKMRLIGPSATNWADAVVEGRGVEAARVLQGVLAMSRKHSADEIEAACATALHSGAINCRIIRTLLKRKAGANQTTMEFFELMLQDEINIREDRQITRRIKQASFRDVRRLEDFDFSFNTTINKSAVFELATGRFVRERRDVLWLGPPGTGKSHLCQAIGLSLIRAGMTVYYRSIFDVVRDFLHDEALDGHERILKRYLAPDLLIIDDMGMKQLPKRSGEYLFEVIMRRHDVRSTMMTSNRPLEEWGKLIGDVPSATAILDRFLHHSDVMQITGRSYRMGNSLKSSNSTKAPTGSPTEES